MVMENLAKAEAAEAAIRAWLKECAEGVSDCEADALAKAKEGGIAADWVEKSFATARKVWDEAREAARLEAAEARPKTPAIRRKVWGSGAAKPELFISPAIPPEVESVAPAQPEPEEPEPQPEPPPKAKFHPSDFAKQQSAKPTIEEKQRALEELADLRETDPLAYAEKRKDWGKRLFTTVAAIDQAVKLILAKRTDVGEQNLATKLVAVGMKQQLWQSPIGDSYATVLVGGHRENYRIGTRAFERWLRSEYGNQNQVLVDGEMVPHVPGAGAVKDAIGNLDGVAKFRGLVREPAIRVGGDYEVIWIDLGGEDWRAVRVTAEGWEIVTGSEVAFVRSGTMLALPEPTRGGRYQMLEGVLNLRKGDLVLAGGWHLQTLNPVGPYPLINICGASEDGKSTTSKNFLRGTDPNSAGLRRPSRKVEDILLAAKNNWIIGLDNMSWMTAEASDTFCMISTGVASGTRAHYTNDEEHVYEVMRPMLFNGIAGNLIERSDLASRTIKLQIPHLAVRRGPADLEEEFQRVWPGVFGALLDGLVGALRGWREIEVADPARLMDFERFAEAGCRAMGFGEWEFVKAYAANRQSSMMASAEGSAVGRAVMKFMDGKDKDGAAKKFEGKMSALNTKLQTHRDNHGQKDWPATTSLLSTELSRLMKPLAESGIEVRLQVDRRKAGGSQQDVILTRMPSASRNPV
jgi:hypothetical protein